MSLISDISEARNLGDLRAILSNYTSRDGYQFLPVSSVAFDRGSNELNGLDDLKELNGELIVGLGTGQIPPHVQKIFGGIEISILPDGAICYIGEEVLNFDVETPPDNGAIPSSTDDVESLIYLAEQVSLDHRKNSFCYQTLPQILIVDGEISEVKYDRQDYANPLLRLSEFHRRMEGFSKNTIAALNNMEPEQEVFVGLSHKNMLYGIRIRRENGLYHLSKVVGKPL